MGDYLVIGFCVLGTLILPAWFVLMCFEYRKVDAAVRAEEKLIEKYYKRLADAGIEDVELEAIDD